MENNWFEAKVKYDKVTEEGKRIKANGTYLVDALSYTEAESRIVEEIKETTPGEFYITGLKPSKITEVVGAGSLAGDKWYRGIVDVMDTDEAAGKEKRTRAHYLVPGESIDDALANLRKELANFLVPVDIVSVQDSPIEGIFIYEETKQRHGVAH